MWEILLGSSGNSMNYKARKAVAVGSRQTVKENAHKGDDIGLFVVALEVRGAVLVRCIRSKITAAT